MTGFLRTASAADGLSLPHNHFGLLRLVLALAVVVSHALSVTTGRVEDELLAHSTGFTLGEHAVNGFFAISGFLVTMSYEQRGWRDYVVARTLRIAPGLIAATLVVSLLLGSALTTLDLRAYLSDPRLWRFIGATLTSFKSSAPLPGVFADNPLTFPMGTVWTLKYETLCYLGVLVAGLAGLLGQRRIVLGLWAALVVATVLREILTPDGPKGVETALRLPLIFLTGGWSISGAKRCRCRCPASPSRSSSSGCPRRRRPTRRCSISSPPGACSCWPWPRRSPAGAASRRPISPTASISMAGRCNRPSSRSSRRSGR